MNYKLVFISFIFILIAPSLSAQDISRRPQLEPYEDLKISFKPRLNKNHYFINDQRVTQLLFEGALNDDPIAYNLFDQKRRRANLGKTLFGISSISLITSLILPDSTFNNFSRGNASLTFGSLSLVAGAIIFTNYKKMNSILNKFNDSDRKKIGLLIHRNSIGISIVF